MPVDFHTDVRNLSKTSRGHHSEIAVESFVKFLDITVHWGGDLSINVFEFMWDPHRMPATWLGDSCHDTWRCLGERYWIVVACFQILCKRWSWCIATCAAGSRQVFKICLHSPLAFKVDDNYRLNTLTLQICHGVHTDCPNTAPCQQYCDRSWCHHGLYHSLKYSLTGRQTYVLYLLCQPSFHNHIHLAQYFNKSV